jgi:hypothetical protein
MWDVYQAHMVVSVSNGRLWWVCTARDGQVQVDLPPNLVSPATLATNYGVVKGSKVSVKTDVQIPRFFS